MSDERETSSTTTAAASTACMSCGTPHARNWRTPDGVARLCQPCATLHGLGCP
ncbi:MAG: hypothetical protein HY828_13370 [Actinobacteria bacterium]|nr:hypothetical protein [Actinomycetota bacterium]